MDGQVAKGRLDPAKRGATLARVHTTTDYAQLAGCQMVIEAVFEDRAVKAEAARCAEAAMDADAIFASNASTPPITGLAEISSRPAQFVGLHFFSPVEKMPLLEVIRGEKTSEATIAHALDFAKKIRKTPIVVNDCPSFYANLAFTMFPYEAMTMLGESVSPALIENVGRQAGMPMPPLALIDEVSAELLHKAMKQARADQGAAYREQPQDLVLVTMVEKLGRLGRKVGQGFYDYPAEGGKRLWPGLAEVFPLAAEQPTADEVCERLMYAQSLVAARCWAGASPWRSVGCWARSTPWAPRPSSRPATAWRAGMGCASRCPRPCAGWPPRADATTRTERLLPVVAMGDAGRLRTMCLLEGEGRVRQI